MPARYLFIGWTLYRYTAYCIDILQGELVGIPGADEEFILDD